MKNRLARVYKTNPFTQKKTFRRFLVNRLRSLDTSENIPHPERAATSMVARVIAMLRGCRTAPHSALQTRPLLPYWPGLPRVVDAALVRRFSTFLPFSNSSHAFVSLGSLLIE